QSLMPGMGARANTPPAAVALAAPGDPPPAPAPQNAAPARVCYRLVKVDTFADRPDMWKEWAAIHDVTRKDGGSVTTTLKAGVGTNWRTFWQTSTKEG